MIKEASFGKWQHKSYNGFGPFAAIWLFVDSLYLWNVDHPQQNFQLSYDDSQRSSPWEDSWTVARQREEVPSILLLAIYIRYNSKIFEMLS